MRIQLSSLRRQPEARLALTYLLDKTRGLIAMSRREKESKGLKAKSSGRLQLWRMWLKFWQWILSRRVLGSGCRGREPHRAPHRALPGSGDCLPHDGRCTEILADGRLRRDLNLKYLLSFTKRQLERPRHPA